MHAWTEKEKKEVVRGRTFASRGVWWGQHQTPSACSIIH